MGQDDETSSGSDEEETQTGSQLADVKIKLKSARTVFTKACNRLRGMLQTPIATENIPNVKCAFECCKKARTKVCELSMLIFRSKFKSDTARTAEESKYEEYELAFEEIEYQMRLIYRLHPEANDGEVNQSTLNNSGTNRNENQATNSTMVSEPTTVMRSSWKEITQRIPKFEGDPTKFTRWKDAFVLHVDSKDWDPLEKFEFMLKTVSGKVAQAISSWRVAADNYAGARDTIFERFGEISLVEDQHVDKIIAACSRKDLHSNDKLIAFIYAVVQNTESLITLGNSYEGMSPILSRMISKAMPVVQQRRFDDVYKPGDESKCKLKALIEFLNTERRSLERLALTAESRKTEGNRFTSNFRTFHQSGGGANYPNYRNTSRGHNPAGPSGALSSQFAFAVTSPNADHSCIFCSSNDHSSARCREPMSVEDRRKCATTQNACFRCLARNHRAEKCRSRTTCSTCGGRHSKLLCLKTNERRPTSTAAAAVTNSDDTAGVENVSAYAVRVCDLGTKCLPTGYVEVLSPTCESVSRLIIDTGSQKTLITNKLADLLGALQVGTETFYLQSAGYASPRRCRGRIFDLTIKSRFSDKHMVIRATALDHVVEGQLPTAEFAGKLSPIADKNDEGWSTDIDILLGVDYLYPVIGRDARKVNGFIALETQFGYFLCGTGVKQEVKMNPELKKMIKDKRASWAAGKSMSEEQCTAAILTTKAREDAEDIRFLWETELLGIEPSSVESDEAAREEMLKFFKESTTRTPEGNYMISLPFKPNISTLGENRKLVENRLRGLIRQGKKNPKMLKAIDKEIENLLAQNFIEYANKPKPGDRAHYLPLMAVIRKAVSTPENIKVRLVNDAGARAKDEAGLNDVLYQGENLIAEILAVLLQFRQLPIVITADIEKAYNQFIIKHQCFSQSESISGGSGDGHSTRSEQEVHQQIMTARVVLKGWIWFTFILRENEKYIVELFHRC